LLPSTRKPWRQSSPIYKTVEVSTTKVTTTGQDAGTSSRQIETHAKDIDRDTRRIINSVKEGIGTSYYAHRTRQPDDPGASKLDIRVEVAALLRADGVIAQIEAVANKFVKEQLTRFAVEIKNTTGARRDAYRRVQEQTTVPEAITVELRLNEKAATKDGQGLPLRTFDGHIYSDAVGKFPAKLNEWEEEVVTTEIARPSFVAWYRNPQRATANSLRIPYKDEGGNLEVTSDRSPDHLKARRRQLGRLNRRPAR
jgi:type III restriction enzyme